MKKIALIIGSMIAGGIISAAGFTWVAKAEPPAEKTSTAERKILFWYDPMYPNTRFDKPGKSPFMDMDRSPFLMPDATRPIWISPKFASSSRW